MVQGGGGISSIFGTATLKIDECFGPRAFFCKRLFNVLPLARGSIFFKKCARRLGESAILPPQTLPKKGWNPNVVHQGIGTQTSLWRRHLASKRRHLASPELVHQGIDNQRSFWRRHMASKRRHLASMATTHGFQRRTMATN